MSGYKDLGRRCAVGCETWPALSIYRKCPVCGEETKVLRGVEPLDADEALVLRRQAEFEIFYENEWESDESPLPDDVLERIEAWPERFEKRKTYKPPPSSSSRGRGIHGAHGGSGRASA